MKLRTLYDLAVAKGLSSDPRPKNAIKEDLAAAKKEFKALKGIEKKAFDKERLKHPYGDTRVLFGKDDAEVKNVLVGIDIGVGELLLADRLRGRGVRIDLVISHHPSGRGLAQLSQVMSIQTGIWQGFGLSKEVAEGIMKDRVGEVARGIAPSNLTQTVDAARILGIPFMCCHTAADNCVTTFLQDIFEKEKPKTLKNIMDILMGIPEYRHSVKIGNGPFILVGDAKKKSGRIFVDMTGGTSGPDRMYGRLAQAGVGTIVGMHCKESAFKTASSEFINYVIAGHISSDNLGMNLIFDAVEKRGKLNIIECSGFKRFKRI
jgi:hypothetical protein